MGIKLPPLPHVAVHFFGLFRRIVVMKFYSNFNEMFNAQSGVKKDMSVFNKVVRGENKYYPNSWALYFDDSLYSDDDIKSLVDAKEKEGWKWLGVPFLDYWCQVFVEPWKSSDGHQVYVVSVSPSFENTLHEFASEETQDAYADRIGDICQQCVNRFCENTVKSNPKYSGALVDCSDSRYGPFFSLTDNGFSEDDACYLAEQLANELDKFTPEINRKVRNMYLFDVFGDQVRKYDLTNPIKEKFMMPVD